MIVICNRPFIGEIIQCILLITHLSHIRVDHIHEIHPYVRESIE